MIRAAGLPAILLVVAATGMSAQTRPVIADRCGTSIATTDRDASVRRWVSAHEKAVTPATSERDGTIVLRADDINTPFRHPFDLAGRSLRFRRQDDRSFLATNEALVTEAQLGALVNTDEAYPLPFEFPFFGRRLTEIWISRFNGIFTTAPEAVAIDQYGPIEIAAQPAAIAPLLTTASVIGDSGADVYVRAFADRVVVTWLLNSGLASYRVSATLFASGDVLFSYPDVRGVLAGAIVISPGREAEPVQDIAAASDEVRDVTSAIPSSLSAGLDIEAVALSQIGDAGLVEFRVTLREPPVISGLRPSDYLAFDVSIGGTSHVTYFLIGDGSEEFAVPVWGATLRNPAARIEGRTLVLDVLTDYLGVEAGQPVAIIVTTALSSVRPSADTASLRATFPAPQRSVVTRFRALDRPTSITGIAAEAFTLPIFNPEGAWEQLKSRYQLRDADFDAVAFYQNFMTDIVFYAGAYSTGGNPGVDGINVRRGISTSMPLSPSLLHMNRIGFAKNTDVKSAARVLMHEFGHHWLFGFELREGGSNSRVLNPVGQHPAQYVDTRAAFTVYDSDDASVMGGGHFDDHHNSTFSSSKYSAYGYSWIDLYLMGLAGTDEVQPSFYIANSSPALGAAYFPPELRTFRGDRREVKVQQILDAMGPRVPAYPATKRHFSVLFVLVEDPDAQASPADIALVSMYRDAFSEKFRIATGERADVATTWRAPSPRRRAAGR